MYKFISLFKLFLILILFYSLLNDVNALFFTDFKKFQDKDTFAVIIASSDILLVVVQCIIGFVWVPGIMIISFIYRSTNVSPVSCGSSSAPTL